MPHLEHDGIRFHYEIEGQGPNLVFSHGLVGSLENARELIGEVAGYRLLLWDARGHGKTSPVGPPSGFAFDTFAQDLAVLLDHLGIHTAVMGGISMGAAVSTRFAIRYPDRVRGLVLIRPAWLREAPEGLRLFPIAAEYMERFGVRDGLHRFEERTDYQKVLEQYPETAEGVRGQFLLDDAWERRGRLTGIPSDTPIRDWSEVENLRIPALVIGNEPDYVHPLSYATTWAERLPRGSFAQVPAKSEGFEPYALAVRRHLAAFLRSLEESS